MTEEEKQAHIHEALVEAMRDVGYLKDDQILTGWCFAFEKASASGDASAGTIYGPASMTTWRAIGLLQWADRFCLGCGEDEDDDE